MSHIKSGKDDLLKRVKRIAGQIQAVERALEALRNATGLEIVSIELRDALHDLAEVIGETTNEDILTRLFQNFCIGK